MPLADYPDLQKLTPGQKAELIEELKSLSLNNGCSLETNQPACQADETPVGKTLFLMADKELAAAFEP
jgi:hypothetical protein